MNEEIEIIDTEDEPLELTGLSLLTRFFTREQGANGEIFIPLPNITHLIDDDTLDRIGQAVTNGYDTDWDSMSDWVSFVEKGRELVKQEKEGRSIPWDGASNFKTPMVMNASLKFSDRSSTELLRQRDVIKTAVIGDDQDGQKAKRSNRVATYMNYQINTESPEWREEHEKLLYAIPYTGTEFKKTFFDAVQGKNDSVIISYPNFAVNQAATSLARLRRFSEIIDLSENEVLERQAQGLWEDVELTRGGESNVEEQAEDDNFSQFIEQQGFYDIDGDGYQEPYTFVVHRDTSKVMRIIPRFEVEDVVVKANGKSMRLNECFDNPEIYEMVRIKPCNNITKYGFIRDPQGEFLDVGFYHLLGALAASINSVTNQLVDSGTLANRGPFSGWLAKGFKTKMGRTPFKLGEWKETMLNANDLQSGMKSLPFGQPSPVLYQLMQMMIASAQELSASTDLSTSLGANAPATTTLALVQEQQQFAGAIILRLYRSMSSEFTKLFELNAKYLDPIQYKEVLDDDEADFSKDFNLKDMDIIPVANPEISSKLQRIQLAEVEMSKINEIAAAGGDPRPVVRNFLEMVGTVNIDEIFPEQQPEEILQSLLARNPQLQEIIMQEQQRAQLVIQAQQEAMQAEEYRKDAKLAMELDKAKSEIEKNEAVRIKTLEEAETEQTKNLSNIYTTSVQLDKQSLENEALNEQRRLSSVEGPPNNQAGLIGNR